MYQFGVNRKNATTKEDRVIMALPHRLTWQILLAAGMLLLLPHGKMAMTPTSASNSFVEACQVKHNITVEDLEQFPDDPSPEDIDMKFKCYANCLLNGLGFMTADGKLDAESMHEMGILNDGSYEYMLECKAANDMEDDPCEYSFGMMLCAKMLETDRQEEEVEELDELEEDR